MDFSFLGLDRKSNALRHSIMMYVIFTGKGTPVSSDPSKPCDPFQPFGGDAIDPFQSKKALGDPFSGNDPFAPSSASSKDSKNFAFADLSSVS